jgi:hypothetical protein
MLKPVSRRSLIEKLKKCGFDGFLSATRHQYMIKGQHKIFIPNPHGKDIGVPLLKKIIDQLGITIDEFNNL